MSLKMFHSCEKKIQFNYIDSIQRKRIIIPFLRKILLRDSVQYT